MATFKVRGGRGREGREGGRGREGRGERGGREGVWREVEVVYL